MFPFNRSPGTACAYALLLSDGLAERAVVFAPQLHTKTESCLRNIENRGGKNTLPMYERVDLQPKTKVFARAFFAHYFIASTT